MRFFCKVVFILVLALVLLYPWHGSLQAAETDCPAGTPAGTVCLPNPLAGAGVVEPSQLVIAVIQAFAAIMGVVAVAFVVFTGFKLIVATNEEAIKNAREGVKWSVLGFVVSILAFTGVSGAAKLLGFDPGLVDRGSDILVTPLKGPQDPRDFISIMIFVMINFLGLIGFAATLMILYYGYKYMTSAGNEEAVEQAKTGLRWTVAGLAIVLLAFTIIASVQKYLLGL